MHGLRDNLEVRFVNAAVAAGSTINDNSTIVDMADAESVMFIVPIVDSVATGVAALTVESNDANSDSGMAAVSGAVATATCGTNDDLNDTLLIVEIRHPAKRYVQAVITSLTANIAFGATTAIIKPRRGPVTQGATVQASAYVSG